MEHPKLNMECGRVLIAIAQWGKSSWKENSVVDIIDTIKTTYYKSYAVPVVELAITELMNLGLIQESLDSHPSRRLYELTERGSDEVEYLKRKSTRWDNPDKRFVRPSASPNIG